MRIEDLCSYAPKSQIKAGEAVDSAKYMFFTSSADENKRYPDYQLDGEGIIMGTGGNATLHYYSGKYATSTDCVVLLPNDQIRCKYLYYFFKANMNILEAGFKGAGLKHTNKKYISDICINNIPGFDKQDEVVSVLDKLQDIIKSRKKELLLLDDLIKARFVELFNDKYDTVKIGDVFSTASGGTPSKSHPEYYENGTIPWLSSGEVNIGVIHSVKNYITQEGVDNSSAKMVPENSVVIAMYGATAGQVGLLRIATTTNQAVCSVLPDKRYVPEYLYYAIKLKKDWMISQCAGGAQPNISQGVIKRMEIIDAPYELQKQFASFVEQTNKSKAAIQKSLNLYQELFDKLMNDYFGG